MPLDGESVAEISGGDPEFEPSPEELGEGFEGDMFLTTEQFTNMMSKTGIINTNYRWPSSTIPYVIGPEYSKDLHKLSTKIISL